MDWPPSMLKIIIWFYKLQEKSSDKTLDPKQRAALVADLRRAYDDLPVGERGDTLVPASADFLEPSAIHHEYTAGRHTYCILYRWPPNNGFEGEPTEVSPKLGETFDRLGGPWGKCVAPIKENPQSFLARAIPYYIPEDEIQKNAAYHRYRLVKTLACPVLSGKIAHAFWNDPDDGGGTQMILPSRTLLKGGPCREW